MASPKGTRFSPKVSRSFSPVKKSTAPPLFGKVAAISAKAFPAVAALDTASVSRPLILLENPIILSPKPTSCSPNTPISLSPAKNPATPPLLGRVAAISASVFPAIAAVLTRFPSKPEMVLENFIMASPNGTSSSAKAPKEDPPVSQEVRLSRRSTPVIIRIAPAKALTPSRREESIPRAPSIKGCTLAINCAKSAPI